MLAVAELTWTQVAAWRSRRHGLSERVGAAHALDVVRRLCGLHAQLMSSAELTLHARVDGLAVDAVQRALWEERSLVKTWAMRGTLHLLVSADYPLWQAALSTERRHTKGAWQRAFGVTAAQVEALLAAVSEALDGPPLTREELALEVARSTGSAELGDRLRESWGALLKPAAFSARLCFGPSDGQLVRFTRPDRWLALDGARPALDPAAATAVVTRRFLAAHGPATREDLARWWGRPPAEARRMLAALGDEVATVDVEGAAMSVLAADLPSLADVEPVRAVRLLPAFDAYVVAATRHAERLMPGPYADRVYRPQGWLSPVLFVDGALAGVWRHERVGTRLVVTVEPFAAVRRGVRAAVQGEAERLADLLGGRLELTWA